ncbi:protein of unknown function [Bradyrhizobium vignae]|uniref:Uncharacterized protein n=2 Tax=Bradyrhizobium vignae TaxID=1549949 RepID=A0A2U3PZM8_9BRAD|nr:protein of unknown function [Bradyrhizobium vignae]
MTPGPKRSTFVNHIALAVNEGLPEDATRFEALRASMVEQGKQGKHGAMGGGVAAKQFCRTNAAPQATLPVTIYLMTSETKSFTPS